MDEDDFSFGSEMLEEEKEPISTPESVPAIRGSSLPASDSIARPALIDEGGEPAGEFIAKIDKNWEDLTMLRSSGQISGPIGINPREEQPSTSLDSPSILGEAVKEAGGSLLALGASAAFPIAAPAIETMRKLWNMSKGLRTIKKMSENSKYLAMTPSTKVSKDLGAVLEPFSTGITIKGPPNNAPPPPDDFPNLFHEPYNKKRVNMLDLFGKGQYDIQINENGLSTYDQTRALKSEDAISDWLSSQYQSIIDAETPRDALKFAFSSMLNVQDISESNSTFYVTQFLKDWEPEEFAKFRLNEESKDTTLKLLLDTGFTSPDPLANKMAASIQKASEIAYAGWKQAGIPMNKLENYLAQPLDPRKVVSKKDEFIKDMMNLCDWERMGLKPTPEILYEAMQKHYVNQSLGNAGMADPRHERVIHYKNSSAYKMAMQKYGKYDDILEIFHSFLNSTAHMQSRLIQFGPKPKQVLDDIMNKLQPREYDNPIDIALLKGVRNLYGALTGGGGIPFEVQSTWVPQIWAYGRAMNEIGLSILVKNASFLYGIFSTGIHSVRIAEKYGFFKGGPLKALQEIVDNLASAFHLRTPEQLDMMKTIAIYGTGEKFFPYSQRMNDPYESPLWARKTKSMIDKLSMHHRIQSHNLNKNARLFRNRIGEWAEAGTRAEDLPFETQELFMSAGINPEEWDIVLSKRDLFIDKSFKLEDVIGGDGDTPIAFFAPKMEELSELERAIAQKFFVLENRYVFMSETIAHPLSTAAFLGPKNQGLGNFLMMNFTALRNYTFDTISRSVHTSQFNKTGWSKENLWNVFLWSLFAGSVVAVMRWLATGKKPKLETNEDALKLFGDILSRGDVFPFSFAAEMFADHYHTAGNNFAQNTSRVASKVLPVGLQHMSEMAYGLMSGTQSAIDGNWDRAFQNVRRFNPLSSWLPTDFLFNRFVLDNMFKFIDEDGAYELFKREIERNNKQHFQYFVRPGDLSGFDVGPVVEQEALEAHLRSLQSKMRRKERSGEPKLALFPENSSSNAPNPRKNQGMPPELGRAAPSPAGEGSNSANKSRETPQWQKDFQQMTRKHRIKEMTLQQKLDLNPGNLKAKNDMIKLQAKYKKGYIDLLLAHTKGEEKHLKKVKRSLQNQLRG